MAERKTYTPEGYQALLDELAHWKEEREKNKKEISEARSYGDLSENSEYDEAKRNQAIIAGKIEELEEMIRNAVVLDASEIDYSKANIGAIVKVKNITRGKEVTYHIVDATKADPFNGLLSHESPIGSALCGHGVGETVIATLPNGSKHELEILSVERA